MELGLQYKKEENFTKWYTDLLNKTNLIEYGSVSGCYVLRPWSYAIWEHIKNNIDSRLKENDVQNAYFPLFVKKSALEKEKKHIDGFVAEVAWITRLDNGHDNEEDDPIAIRPTSETIIYPHFAKWIRSINDLPLKINQWCNIVRWEFKDPTPFIRSREFLWQEGHNVFFTADEAEKDTIKMCNMYKEIYKNVLAVPVICGRKTETEKFAGAEFTTTCEAFIPECGKAIQAATSHFLGQKFSKIFNIKLSSGQLLDQTDDYYLYQNSWGFTTRSIGVMIMTHCDNKGLVLPPTIAPIQVIIVPIYNKKSPKEIVRNKCSQIKQFLQKQKIRVKFDDSDAKPGWKYNHWELMGVPIRIEVGSKDIATNTCIIARRDIFEKSRIGSSEETLVREIIFLINNIQNSLYDNAKKRLIQSIRYCDTFESIIHTLQDKKMAKVLLCGNKHCEEILKQNAKKELKYTPKTLCQFFVTDIDKKCLYCDNKGIYTLFAKSY